MKPEAPVTKHFIIRRSVSELKRSVFDASTFQRCDWVEFCNNPTPEATKSFSPFRRA
jgi:hypothetical protein